jgi:hypothetical protein
MRQQGLGLTYNNVTTAVKTILPLVLSFLSIRLRDLLLGQEVEITAQPRMGAILAKHALVY